MSVDHNTPRLPRNAADLVEHLRTLGLEMRAAVGHGVRTESVVQLATATAEQGGEMVFRLDVHAEEVLLAYSARCGDELPFLLVAEGLPGGEQISPRAGVRRSRTPYRRHQSRMWSTRSIYWS